MPTPEIQATVIAHALQRYLADKRIEAAHNTDDSAKSYAQVLSMIEETCIANGVDISNDRMEFVRQQRPGCHHK